MDWRETVALLGCFLLTGLLYWLMGWLYFLGTVLL